MKSSPSFRLRLAQIRRGARGSALLALLALAGCNTWETRSEFAPPQSRWTTGQPSSTAVNAPPPPAPVQYCYRTLATVDCFAQPQPDRVTGYTGVYPDPASLQVITPPPPKAAATATIKN
jgi:hypothetical protein